MVVRAAKRSALRSYRAHHSKVFEWSDGGAHDRRRFGRTEHAGSARAPSSRVDVEVACEFPIIRFRLFKRAEVLFHVSLRAEQSFFFTASGGPNTPAPRARPVP